MYFNLKLMQIVLSVPVLEALRQAVPILSSIQTQNFTFNTLRTGDADLRFYFITVQDE